MAHPDDETIGAGALLLRSTDAHVIVVTEGVPAVRSAWPNDGASRTPASYGLERKAELLRAMRHAGIGDARVHLLGFADAAVTEHLAAVVTRLAGLFSTLRPEVVVTHAYEGGHPDHDAVALAVHLACREVGLAHPHEAALYHHADGTLVTHSFIPGSDCGLEWLLEPERAALKERMLGEFASQRRHARYFETRRERYRCAPAYDFTLPPHAGTLLYEAHRLTSGDDWRTTVQPLLPRLPAAAWAPDSNADGTTRGRPLVSVIVRTIGRPTLRDALASIAAQTYGPIEVVLVNAGVDDLPELADDRAGLSCVTVLAPGATRPAAANRGLAATSGHYVAFLDDDDWFHPTHLENVIARLEQDRQFRVAYAAVQAVTAAPNSHARLERVYAEPFDPTALLIANYIPLNAIVFARSLLGEGIRFDEELLLLEDWDFLIALSRQSPFAQLEAVGAAYRWPSASGVMDLTQTTDVRDRIFRKWQPHWRSEEAAQIAARAATLADELAVRSLQMTDLQAHVSFQDEQLRATAELASRQGQQLEQLRPHLEHQDAEIAELRPVVAAQERQLEELRPHLQRQDAELAQLRLQTSVREQRLADLNARLEAALRGLTTALARSAEVEARRLSAEQDAAASRTRLDDVLQSRSWRWTAPVRAALALLLGQREGR
ncbi:MAG: PIG-L family deacetylase [Vicinamibacterales bacterium]